MADIKNEFYDSNNPNYSDPVLSYTLNYYRGKPHELLGYGASTFPPGTISFSNFYNTGKQLGGSPPSGGDGGE